MSDIGNMPCPNCGQPVGASDEIERLTAEVERLRESIFWACGVNGTFALRQDGEGAYWWRRELRARAGISGEELNRRALDGEEVSDE